MTMFFIRRNIRAFMKDIVYALQQSLLNFGDLIISFLCMILLLIRIIVYKVFCLLSVVAAFGFVASFYYGYLIVFQLQKGVPFSAIQNINTFAVLFFVPIVVFILKKILEPSDI